VHLSSKERERLKKWKRREARRRRSIHSPTSIPIPSSKEKLKNEKRKNKKQKTKKKNYSSHRISNKKIHPFSYFFPPFPLPSSLTTVTSRYFSISQMKKKPPKSHSLSLSLSLCLFLMIKTQPPAPSFVFLKMEEIFRPFAHPSTPLPIAPTL